MNLPSACLRFVTAVYYHSTSVPLGENADLTLMAYATTFTMQLVDLDTMHGIFHSLHH